MKKIIGFLLLVTAFQVQAIDLETPGTFMGPMAVGQLFKSWETNLEANATSSAATVAADAVLIANLTPVFDTNTVIGATNYVPAVKGQLLVGATNLWVAVGLTSNSWLQIK